MSLTPPAITPRVEDEPADVEKARRDMIRRAREDNDGLADRESFMDIAYAIKYEYEGFTDFIEAFKKAKPNYFRYFKEWYGEVVAGKLVRFDPG